MATTTQKKSGMKWYWWVLIGLFFVAAGGGVLYGVLTHKEPGLLKVCWNASGQAVYEQPGCEQELKWAKNRLPLTYYIDFGKDHQDYIKSIVAGADMWNKEIGTEVFKRTESPNATVTVSWGSVQETAAGHASHTGSKDSGPTNAVIVISEPSDVHAVYRYAAHEWGHVLGLAHDDFKSSIMYLMQPDMTRDELNFVLPSDYDKKLLRELYR